MFGFQTYSVENRTRCYVSKITYILHTHTYPLLNLLKFIFMLYFPLPCIHFPMDRSYYILATSMTPKSLLFIFIKLLQNYIPGCSEDAPCKNWPFHLSFQHQFLKTVGELGFFELKSPILLASPCIIPFSTPNSDILVCSTSQYIGDTNLHSATQMSLHSDLF